MYSSKTIPTEKSNTPSQKLPPQIKIDTLFYQAGSSNFGELLVLDDFKNDPPLEIRLMHDRTCSIRTIEELEITKRIIVCGGKAKLYFLEEEPKITLFPGSSIEAVHNYFNSQTFKLDRCFCETLQKYFPENIDIYDKYQN